MAGLEARGIRFAVGKKEILRGVSLDAAPGETVALLGPSGCGKTTLLRVIAGLERPSNGRVVFDGVDVTDVPAHRRGFGMMFQEHALFPHMSVRRNVEFGLRQARWDGARREGRVTELLEAVGLVGFGERGIEGLSGGERQRVALARTLAPEPRMLMLDEPLGSLDRGLREQLVVELRRVLEGLGIPAIYVTHDQFEAFAMADRLAIMRAGLVVRDGAPGDVFAEPRTEFVARFLGLDNILPGTMGAGGMVETEAGAFGPVESAAGEAVLLLRGEGAQPVATGGPNVVSGTAEARLFQGASQRLMVRAGAALLAFTFDSSVTVPGPGEAVHLRIGKVQVLEPDA